jgi:hypothetical protein
MTNENTATVPILRQYGSNETTSIPNGVNKQQFVTALINV